MVFKRADFNTTEHVPEKGILTGRRNAAFLRNRYQTELDNANAAVVDMVHYCEEQSVELKQAFNKAQGIKASITAHETERENAYEALGNLISKEEKLEKEMWKTTTDAQKDIAKNQKTSTVKQKTKFGDQEVTFNSMMKVMDKYPEYQSKSSFKQIMNKIEEKEKELREAKIDYNKAVSAYHDLLQRFKIYIQKAKDKVKMYHQTLDVGQKEIDGTRYKKGFVYKLFASERSKQEINLDTLKHRIPQFENTLKIIEEELSGYEGRKFVELAY
jgi:hypothetical protein